MAWLDNRALPCTNSQTYKEYTQMIKAERNARCKASPLIRFIYFILCAASLSVAQQVSAQQVSALTTSAPMQPPQTSWIGNSFSGREAWVPHNMDTLFVRPDGTAYTNTFWEEGTHEVTIFKGGKVIGGSTDLHGWG